MDFDLNWVLLGLPVAFVLGWLASRLDLRQLRIEDRAAPKAYFRGLNFLLNEQQDQAIDAFIEAVQNDPDTSELHFALGNLFRRRGEYERAVRVHEHLLSRGDLGQAERERAQHALALDFLKAGLLDRAEDALRKLEGTPFQSEARLARLAIYERTRDWPAATDIARKLQASGDISFANRMAHYLCEQAAAANGTEADKLLKEAIALAPTAPRAHLALAVAQARAGHPALAFNTLLANVNTAQAAIPLIAKELAIQAKACGQESVARDALATAQAKTASLDVMDALASLESRADDARQWYAQHLQREPSLVAATRWMANPAEPGSARAEEVAPHLQRALDHAVRPLLRYRCAACGFTAKQHFWQCPGCQAWDSYPARRVEEL